VLPPSESIHKFSAQTREDAIADTVSRQFTYFTYKFRIKIQEFYSIFLIQTISTADIGHCISYGNAPMEQNQVIWGRLSCQPCHSLFATGSLNNENEKNLIIKWQAEEPVGPARLSLLQIDIAGKLNINTQTSKVANKEKGKHSTHRFHYLEF